MKLYASILLLLVLGKANLFGQYENKEWIIDLATKISDETDLCERCFWVSPTIAEVELSGEVFIFLRYSCSTNDGFARMYDLEGNIISECNSINGVTECGFGRNAFTVFTFADRVKAIWNCTKGFECDFAQANSIEKRVPIFVDDTQCAEGVKILKVSDEYQTYSWSGNNITGNEASLEIKDGGWYTVVVKDEMDCAFEGEIYIPDIKKLNVKIKGPGQFCPGTNVELKTTSFQTYQWSTGGGNAAINITEPGLYEVIVTNDQNCDGAADFEISHYPTVDPVIIADASEVIEGNPVNVYLANGPYLDYNWTGNGKVDCATCPETSFYPSVDNELRIAVQDENNCISTDTVTFNVLTRPLEIFAPNIFRPGSEQGNNKFALFGGPNIQLIEVFDVFDRWGNLVYSAKNLLPNQPEQGWDGTFLNQQVKQDVYLYRARVLFVNGQHKTFSGDIFLMK